MIRKRHNNQNINLEVEDATLAANPRPLTFDAK